MLIICFVTYLEGLILLLPVLWILKILATE